MVDPRRSQQQFGEGKPVTSQRDQVLCIIGLFLSSHEMNPHLVDEISLVAHRVVFTRFQNAARTPPERRTVCDGGGPVLSLH